MSCEQTLSTFPDERHAYFTLDIEYGPLDVTNASKHFLIDQFVKFFFLIG